MATNKGFAEERFSLLLQSETQKWVQFSNVYPCWFDQVVRLRFTLRSPGCFPELKYRVTGFNLSNGSVVRYGASPVRYNGCVTTTGTTTYDDSTMNRVYHPLLAMIASATDRELAKSSSAVAQTLPESAAVEHADLLASSRRGAVCVRFDSYRRRASETRHHEDQSPDG